MFHRPLKTAVILTVSLGLSACGGSKNAGINPADAPSADSYITNNRESAPTNYEASSIWDVFGPDTSEQTANVNRYLWNASLDVLSFLPVQSVDPYTGVILTGYGTPPGGGRSYRATVHIKDAALDARALNVSLQSKGGAVSPSTARAVEDAILSRARQLRIADGKL